jgi:hypothetical protein
VLSPVTLGRRHHDLAYLTGHRQPRTAVIVLGDNFQIQQNRRVAVITDRRCAPSVSAKFSKSLTCVSFVLKKYAVIVDRKYASSVYQDYENYCVLAVCVTLCNLVKVYDVSEENSASIYRCNDVRMINCPIVKVGELTDVSEDILPLKSTSHTGRSRRILAVMDVAPSCTRTTMYPHFVHKRGCFPQSSTLANPVTVNPDVGKSGTKYEECCSLSSTYFTRGI